MDLDCADKREGGQEAAQWIAFVCHYLLIFDLDQVLQFVVLVEAFLETLLVGGVMAAAAALKGLEVRVVLDLQRGIPVLSGNYLVVVLCQ